MKKRKLGNSGLEVSAIGLGCMNMSWGYGNDVSRKDMIHLIHRAADMGLDFLDTAEFYGPFTNEELVGEATASIRHKMIIATKFGFEYDPQTAAYKGLNSKPAHIKQVAEASLKRLKTDYIDLLYQHRVDPEVPMEDVAGAVSDLIREGKVRHFGLSNASPEDIRKAHAVHPVAALQSGYSLWERSVEESVLPVLKELGIGFVPFGPLGHGFLTGNISGQTVFSQNDIRNTFPQFSEENRRAIEEPVSRFVAIAEKKNISPAQLALAWVLHQDPGFAAIPGTTKLHRLEENIAAADISLSAEDLAELQQIKF